MKPMLPRNSLFGVFPITNKLVDLHAAQQEAQDRVGELYARWEELETKAG